MSKGLFSECCLANDWWLLLSKDQHRASPLHPILCHSASPRQKSPLYALNNHLLFKIKYHKPDPEGEAMRIVGFEVHPYSVQHEYEGEWAEDQPGGGVKLKACKPEELNKPNPMVVDQGAEVLFTYEAQFEVGARQGSMLGCHTHVVV